MRSTEAFLHALFKPDDLIEFRPIEDFKGGKPNHKARRWFAGPEAMIEALPGIFEWSEATRHAVFFGVLPRTEKGGGRKEHTKTGHVVWADLDFKDYDDGQAGAEKALRDLGHEPSIIVSSGHGMHAYWLLNEERSAPALESASRTIAAALGADACFDSSRILRLPGSINRKNLDDMRQVEVVLMDVERTYSLAALLDGLESQPASKAQRPAAKGDGWKVKRGELPADLQKLVDNSPKLRDLRAGRGRDATGADGKKLDLTESGYDFAYMIALMQAGVTGVDDLSQALSQRGRLTDRRLRDDYMRRTIDNARAGVREHQHRKRPVEAPPDVWDLLRLNRHGLPVNSILNAHIVLKNTPTPSGRLWFDDFTAEVKVDDIPITDVAETNIALWLDEVYSVCISPTQVHVVAASVAAENIRHPLRDHLESLEWDQEGRATRFLTRYFGAEDSDLNADLGRCWLTSAVARVYEPGCKVDTVLILYGGQGVGKSTALESMALQDRWFADSGIDLKSKDAYGSLHGIWLYEMAELDSMRKTDTEAMKAFISSRTDRFRPPYGRNFITRPRGGIIVGTTNRLSFLTDSTGNRRFWPVSVGEIDLEGIERDAPQLWAEAVQWYKGGTSWWLSDEQQLELARMQEAHANGDGWEPAVSLWLASRAAPFTVADVLIDCIGKELAQIQGGDTARMLRLLQAAGCNALGQCRVNGRKARFWKAPTEVIDLDERR